MKFNIILAVDSKNGIGKNNSLAWKLSSDMKYFKKITSTVNDSSKINAIIMGRKTWESIPSKYKPLPERINCILTKQEKIINNNKSKYVLYFNDFNYCLNKLKKNKNIENIFLIGGGSLYNKFINHKDLEYIYITKLKGDYKCDTFFSGIPDSFIMDYCSNLKNENNIDYTFCKYKRAD